MPTSLETDGIKFPDNTTQRGKDYFYHPVSIGSSYGGGYYVGTLWENNYPYWLIVAPDSSTSGLVRYNTYATTSSTNRGWNSPLTWSDSNSLIDGYNNTEALADRNGVVNDEGLTTNFEAAMYCWNLTLNGYSDWYLPAKREIELLYSARSFLPTAEIPETTTSLLYYWTSCPFWGDAAERTNLYFLAGNFWYADAFSLNSAHKVRPFRRVLIS